MPIRSLRSLVAGQTPITAPKSASVLAAARTMQEHNIGALLVVDGSRLVGIFTERDALFRVVAAARDPVTTKLGDVMTPQPMTAHRTDDIVANLLFLKVFSTRSAPMN